MPLAARAQLRPGREPNSIRAGKDKPSANHASATRNEKASAAAEVCFCREPLLTGGLLFDASSPCSHTVENLDSPQHDDDGQYQRSRRQYTF